MANPDTRDQLRDELLRIRRDLETPELLSFETVVQKLTRWRERALRLAAVRTPSPGESMFKPFPWDVATGDFVDLQEVAGRYQATLDDLATQSVPQHDPVIAPATALPEATVSVTEPPMVAAHPAVPAAAASPASSSVRALTLRLVLASIAVLMLAAIARCGPTRQSESTLSERLLDARKPNVTSPRYFSQPATNGTATSLLLFVHGIFGDTVETWRRSGADSLPAIVLATPEFAGKYDAFAFGFASSMVKAGSFKIPEAATALMTEVTFQQFLTKYDRIVIVAHSMGGLVALEALTTYPALNAQVPLLVTFATPYTGAQVAKLAGDVIQNPALRDMVPGDDNTFLLSLSNRWRQAKASKGIQASVICAYETVPLPAIGMVVPRTSGAALCDGPADAIAEDHIGIIKPDNKDHPSVKVLVNALRSLPSTPAPTRTQVRDRGQSRVACSGADGAVAIQAFATSIVRPESLSSYVRENAAVFADGGRGVACLNDLMARAEELPSSQLSEDVNRSAALVRKIGPEVVANIRQLSDAIAAHVPLDPNLKRSTQLLEEIQIMMQQWKDRSDREAALLKALHDLSMTRIENLR